MLKNFFLIFLILHATLLKCSNSFKITGILYYIPSSGTFKYANDQVEDVSGLPLLWPAYATVKFLEGIKKMEDFTGNAVDKVGDAADKVGDTADKVGDKIKGAPKDIKKLFD